MQRAGQESTRAADIMTEIVVDCLVFVLQELECGGTFTQCVLPLLLSANLCVGLPYLVIQTPICSEGCFMDCTAVRACLWFWSLSEQSRFSL